MSFSLSTIRNLLTADAFAYHCNTKIYMMLDKSTKHNALDIYERTKPTAVHLKSIELSCNGSMIHKQLKNSNMF